MSFKEYASKEYVNAAKELVTLKDIKTGYHYAVFIENGKLSILQKVIGIEVTTLPNKMAYLEGEELDLTGMVVSLISEDGARIPITDYTCGTIPSNNFEINYEYQPGMIFSTSLKMDIFNLVDFDYTYNAEDGTYTINSWKKTLNGVSSGEMVIPDSKYIII